MAPSPCQARRGPQVLTVPLGSGFSQRAPPNRCTGSPSDEARPGPGGNAFVAGHRVPRGKPCLLGVRKASFPCLLSRRAGVKSF